ncbi:hypothetical protein M2132_000273 [Dysgonomonas sp. PH5-45]|nr:hypothetical protein [Dysgonomonas sp. PH5-45]MDH6386855.1 hypothetical protein [Dysgonomonas sp. PH5-37]
MKLNSYIFKILLLTIFLFWGIITLKAKEVCLTETTVEIKISTILTFKEVCLTKNVGKIINEPFLVGNNTNHIQKTTLLGQKRQKNNYICHNYVLLICALNNINAPPKGHFLY